MLQGAALDATTGRCYRSRPSRKGGPAVHANEHSGWRRGFLVVRPTLTRPAPECRAPCSTPPGRGQGAVAASEWWTSFPPSPRVYPVSSNMRQMARVCECARELCDEKRNSGSRFIPAMFMKIQSVESPTESSLPFVLVMTFSKRRKCDLTFIVSFFKKVS